MFEPSQELEQLKGFLSNIPSGAFVRYPEIELQTGVVMNARGKQILRSAMRSIGKEYRTDRGNGIEIESSKNAMQLVTNRAKRVSNALKKADKTTAIMVERYVNDLPETEKQHLLMSASLFGAIRGMAKGLSNIYKPKKLNTVEKIELPKFK